MFVLCVCLSHSLRLACCWRPTRSMSILWTISSALVDHHTLPGRTVAGCSQCSTIGVDNRIVATNWMAMNTHRFRFLGTRIATKQRCSSKNKPIFIQSLSPLRHVCHCHRFKCTGPLFLAALGGRTGQPANDESLHFHIIKYVCMAMRSPHMEFICRCVQWGFSCLCVCMWQTHDQQRSKLIMQIIRHYRFGRAVNTSNAQSSHITRINTSHLWSA